MIIITHTLGLTQLLEHTGNNGTGLDWLGLAGTARALGIAGGWCWSIGALEHWSIGHGWRWLEVAGDTIDLGYKQKLYLKRAGVGLRRVKGK